MKGSRQKDQGESIGTGDSTKRTRNTFYVDKLEELRHQFTTLQESGSRLRQYQEALKDSEERFRETEGALQTRIRLEKIVNDISIQLIGVDSGGLDEAINGALKMIGTFSGVDRSYVFLFTDSPEEGRVSHSYYRLGVEPKDQGVRSLALDAESWWMARLNRNECIHVPRPDHLPLEAEKEKKILTEQGTRSLIAVPMTHKGALMGFVGFESVGGAGAEKKWYPEDIGLLRTVGNIFTMALERKRNEAEKQRLEKLLRHAHKMEAIGTMAGGIAHDFNNILSAIIGYTELTVDEVAPGSDAENNLKQVLSAADRAKETIRQILAFSRKDRMDKVSLHLDRVIAEMCRLLRPMLPSTIEIRPLDCHCTKTVLANPTQIHQLVMNLCTNAGYAMKENGGTLGFELREITVDFDSMDRTELAPGNYLRLSISDTGHGIPEDILKRIFEPYFTTKKHGDGSGMGLAVVHGIVKSHEGNIEVISQPGRGTTFHVFLPTAETNATAPEDATDDNRKPKGGHERILFVDDEHRLAYVGKLVLKKLGYQVLSKTSSLEALEIFCTHPHQFDLVITDQTMPHLTGLQLATRLRKINPHIPVILCTGFSENINEDNFNLHGINAFVLKPIGMREIATTIRQVLDSDSGNRCHGFPLTRPNGLH